MQSLVINNKEGMVIGQLPHELPKGKGETGAGVSSPQVGEQIVFMPGANLVDADKLKQLRANKSFEKNFTTVIPPSEAPEQNPEKVGKPILVYVRELEDVSPLAKVKAAKECEAIIAEMFQTPVLQRWLDEENRGEVRAAIQVQLRKLASGEVGNSAANTQA